MDLQAILDASDDSSDQNISDEPSSSAASAQQQDLERILREEEEEEEDDDRFNDTNQSLSTISTAAHHYHLRKGHTRFLADEASQYSGNGFHTGSHNPEDWAVLQQILGEDEEQEKEDSWLKSPAHKPTSSSSLDVDAILQSIHSDDDDVVAELSHLSVNLATGLSHERYSPAAEASTSTPIMTGRATAPTIQDNEDAGIQLQVAPESTETPITSKTSRKQQQFSKEQDDTEVSDEVITENALTYASTYERRLLRPGHRDIVSPLMVKRRLKPRLDLKGTHASQYNFSGVMEHKCMSSLSAKLVESSQNNGLPTALAVNSKFIAIGTQRGLILVFDLFEVLRQRLGQTSAVDASWTVDGSVTSIDIAMNGETIVAGYTSGVVCLWDVIRGTVLKTVSDTHPSPISHVRYLSQREIKIVTVDAGGLVNKLTFSKNILWSAYSVETECLLDGTAGQILALNVLPSLPKDTTGPDTPFLEKLVLIALSSERSSFAVAVEPSISVLHRWSRPSKEEDEPEKQYLPCLSWGWALVSGGGNVVTPILARAWGCSLQLLRASFPTLEGEDATSDTAASALSGYHWPAFGLHDEFEASAPVVALEWLGERSLVYLTVTNEFLVADTVMMTLLERLDFSGLKLVYAEFSLSRSASKEGDGDLEACPSLALCTTFQNSIRTSDERLLILCQEEVKSVSILGAKRRIAALEQDGEWLEALALALDHYENTIKSQEDRKRDPDGKRDLSKHPEFSNLPRSEDEEWIAKLLIRYLNLAVENAPEGTNESSQPSCSPDRSTVSSSAPARLDLAQSHFQMLAGVCIEFCVTTRRLDLLFGPIFRRFHSVGYLSVFLDVLEPYILNDKLDYIAPEAMAHFVEHCKATNGIATVERCLLHMDVTIMDFDSILSLLRRNEMYSALFYVFTHGLDDFVSPLEILLERIFDGADEGKSLAKRRADGMPQNQFERFGYKAIIYLQHCFNGETFPQKTPLKPDDKLKSLRPQLLTFLQQETYSPSSTVKSGGHGSSAVFGHRALRFPYTHVLLMVDARATLDAFSLAMDAPDADFADPDSAFESIGGWEVEVGDDARTIRSDDTRSPDRQQIISMLSSIILPDDGTKSNDGLSTLYKTQRAVDAFLDFMAKYLLRGIVRANKSVTFMILERMATRFSRATLPGLRQDAQKQIIELLTALPRNAYDPDEVLQLVESAGIHRAALALHQQGASSWHEGVDDMNRRAYHFQSVIDCYLEDSDPQFRKEVFAYVKKECAGAVCVSDSKAGDDVHSSNLRTALCAKLPDLVNLDPILSAQLVAEIYIEELDEVVNSLSAVDEGVSQFKFLHSIISGDLAKVDAVAGPVLNANLTMDHHQVYLALMAKQHPDMVYEYLSTHDNYRSEECLKLCQQYEIADASAYLLERMGSVSSALQLILQTLEGRMMGLKRTIRGMGTELFRRSSSSRHFLSDRNQQEATEQEKKQEKEVERVKRILVVALDLCERNSGSSSSRSEHGSQLWFNVLDRLINAKGFLRLSKEQPAHSKVMAGVLSQLLQLTMQRMVSSVPLPDLVRKVTTDHSGSRLGELREMVESLLSTYGFELDVFTGAVNVMHDDVASMRREHRRLKLEGCAVTSLMRQPLGRVWTGNNASEKGRILRVGDKGDAVFADGGRIKENPALVGGLGGAVQRLRSRRIVQEETSSQAPWDRPRSGLDFLPVSEKLYNDGESSEAADYGDRLVGILGDAEHYGSFR